MFRSQIVFEFLSSSFLSLSFSFIAHTARHYETTVSIMIEWAG
jgi:hypothetical protein